MSLYVFKTLQPLTLVPLCAIHSTERAAHFCCVPRYAGSAILTIAALVGPAGHRDPAWIRSERPWRGLAMFLVVLHLLLQPLLLLLLHATLGNRLTSIFVEALPALVVSVEALLPRIPGTRMQVLA